MERKSRHFGPNPYNYPAYIGTVITKKPIEGTHLFFYVLSNCRMDSFVSKELDLNVMDSVLVIRQGAILPYNLAKKIGRLRYLKNYEVRTLWLKSHPSTCIVLAEKDYRKILPDELCFSKDPKLISGYLKVQYSVKYKRIHGILSETKKQDSNKLLSLFVSFFRKIFGIV